MVRDSRALTSRKEAGEGGGGEAPPPRARCLRPSKAFAFAFASLRGGKRGVRSKGGGRAGPLMWWPRFVESAQPRGGPEGVPRAGAPPPEGEPPDRFSSPTPFATAQMRSPFVWWPLGSGGSRETQPAGDFWARQEGGRHRLARGGAAAATRPAPGDLLGWELAAAAAAGARGPPIDPRSERSGAMGAWGSHPTLEAAAAAARPLVAPRSLQGGDAPSAPAAPFWDPQQDWEEGPSSRPTSSTEKTGSFEEQLQGLRRSSDPLAQELARALETVGRFALHLFIEHQELKNRLHSLETQHRDRVSHLLAENTRLQQEVQELGSSPEASHSPPMGPPQRSAPQPSPPKGQETPGKVFPMQIRTAGKTGGCERLFLNDVSRLLSCQGVSLKVEEYTETSEHPLLMFCPISSRLDIDIECAFQGLSGKQKVLLIVMHYAHKDQTEPFRQQVTTHPSVVMTVHTRFTMLDGMYACEMNKAAVADVADAIKSLADDP